ncbi:hypothetical protein ICNINCKA_01689 [Synechococcus sp. CBW1107]|nr:hypothetical protein ICNINCKA_01689 [Synechococcus sp. CBW1107]
MRAERYRGAPNLKGPPWLTPMPQSRPFLAALLAASVVAALPAAKAAPPTPALLQSLEAALNSGQSSNLAALVESGPGLDPARLEARYKILRDRFPDARWQVSPGTPLRDGRPTVAIVVSGSRSEGPFRYTLQAEQLLALSATGSRLNGQELIRETTTLRSGEANLPVSVLIPDAVLTGQRYDVDVVFDEPLDGAVAAGGIAAITPAQISALETPDLELAALGGGGLFKSVQAPLTPGSQTWAVLLVHPKGIVSTTKRVRVVADKAALTP